MRLRKRVILKIAGFLLLVNTVFMGTAFTIMRTKFLNIEYSTALTDLARTKDILEQEYSFLSALVNEYGKWDETYEFLVDQNPEYLKTNYNNESLSNIQISFVTIYDIKGNIIFSKAIDINSLESQKTPIIPFPLNSEFKGIILIGDTPYILASSKILTSESKGEVRGYIVFGRRLDKTQTLKIAEKAKVEVSIQAIDQNSKSKSINSLESQNYVIDSSSIDKIVITSLIKDIFGSSVLSISVTSPRPVITKLYESLLVLLILILISEFIISTAIITFIDNTILSRINYLHRVLSLNHRYTIDTKQLSVPGNDELSFFAEALQQLLSTINTKQLKIESQAHILELQNQWLFHVASGYSLSEILDLTALLIEAQIPDSLCAIMMYNQDENILYYCSANSLPNEYIQVTNGISIDNCIGSLGIAVLTKSMVITEDISKDKDWQDYKHIPLNFGLQSCWSFPIISPDHKQVFGIFAVYHKQPTLPTREEINLMKVASFATGIAIEREQRNQKIKLQLEKEKYLSEQLQQVIKKREIAEFRLNQVLQELNYHISHTPLGFIRWNGNFQVESWSLKATEIFGWSEAEVLGKNFQDWQFIYEDDIDYVLRDTAELISGKNVSCSNRNYRKDGTIIYCEWYNSSLLDNQGNLVSILSIVQDVTDRKRSELIIKTQKEELDRFFSVALDLLCIVTIDGHFIRLNPRWQDVLGIPINDLEGKNLFDFIYSEDIEITKEMFSKLHIGENISNFLIRFQCINNNCRFLEWSAVSVGNSIYAAARDVTDRYELEQMKDEFISIVSHEIRTPLTAIRGALGMLSSGAYYDKPDRFSRMITIAQNNCERLQSLITDILDLERLDSGKSSIELIPCFLQEIIADAIDTLLPLVKKESVNLLNYSEKIEVYASPLAIHRVLVNLIGNAIKFSPKGSDIIIRSELRENFVIVSITDFGRGIPSDKLDIIFDRFQQVDPSDSRDKGGSGLGLAICKKIIEQHNCKIWVDSELGHGSTFYFSLQRYLTIPKSNNPNLDDNLDRFFDE